MKQNDWLVATLNNPTFEVGDFQHILDMNLDNTQMLSKDQYLKSRYIRENPIFQTDGQFDNSKFDSFYSQQLQRFGEFSTEKTIDNYEYSMWDVMRPKEGRVKEETVQFDVIANPEHIRVGVEGFNAVTYSDQSKKELAQKSKIYDSKTGQFLNKSVDDISFTESPLEYFKSLFSEPLVYATYNEDGTHIDPFTKQEVQHYKGEWKLNEDGEYYTETLNGQSLLDKEVVSAGDYVTPENSRLNRYDFFDSDGLDKSITGTVAKNLVAVSPMIFLGPTGTMLYGGLYVGRELSKTLPMLYGMYQSFTGQEQTDNKLLNTIAAFGDRMTTGTSEYAQQNTFSAENFINLAGEVALQWGQQKAIANAYTRLTTGASNSLKSAYNKAAKEYLERSTDALMNGMSGRLAGARLIEQAGGATQKEFLALIENGKWVNTPIGKAAKAKYVTAAEAAMESRMKLGQDLSLVYMALISNTDVYDSVLHKGGTPLEAAAIALGSTIGMFSVDKYLGLGEMFFTDDAVRQSFRTAWKKEGSDIIDVIRRESGVQVTKPTKKQLTNIIDKSIDKAKNFVQNYHSKIKDHTLGFFGKAFGEGLEEVSEELVTDISKSLGELAGKLGYASQTDYGSWDNSFDRYMMSFFGGALGGGLFYGVDAYQRRNDPRVKEGEDELIYLIRNHKKADLMKELDKLHKQGKLGSTELSYETEKGEDGKDYFITADNGHMSQNDYVYQKLQEVYNHLDTIINNNQVGLSEDELFQNMILSESRYNAMKDFLQKKSYSTRYQEEFHNLAKEITEVDLSIERLNKTTQDPAKRNDPLYQLQLDELLAKKKELQEKRDKFLSGELSLPYIKKMLFAIDPHLCGQFMSINIDQFTREQLGRSYADLSQAEREEINKRYNKYKQDEKFNLDKAYSIYESLEKELMPTIDNMSAIDAKKELERFQKMMEKHPSTQYISWNSKLPTESDDAFLNRDTQLENEDEESFKARKLKREQDIKTYNDEHYAEFIKDFADMGLDSSNFRMMHLMLGQRRKDIVEAIINGYVVSHRLKDPNDPNKTIEAPDKELSELVQNLIRSGKPLKTLLQDLRKDLSEKYRRDINKKYKDQRDQDDGWFFLKNSFLDGKYQDEERLTGRQTLELLRAIKEYYDNNTNFKEGEPTSFDDVLSEVFNDTTIQQFHEMLGFNDELDYARTQYNAVRDQVITELQNTGQIDPSNLSDEDLKKIEEETNSRMQDVNKDLTKMLAKQHPELDIKENEVLSFEQIQDINDQLLNRVIEVNEGSISQEINNAVENTVTLLTPSITDTLKKLDDNPYLKAFDSLEQNLYKQNPALKLFSQISTKIGNVDVSIEDFLQSLHDTYQEIENFQDFKLTDEQKEILKTLLNNLRVVSALIYSASKNTNYNSPIGQNKAVNEFIRNHPKIFKSSQMLPEMSEDLGQFLLMELSIYEAEINAWLNRDQAIRINKISLFKEAEVALDKTLKGFYDTVKSRLIINGVNLLEGYTQETTVLEAERMLYNNVQKGLNEGKFTLDEVFDIIPQIVTDPENIKNQVPSKLDHKLRFLNDYDKFTYFVTTISLPIDQYRTTLKSFIENNKGIVPISLQMYAGRIQQAMQTNPEYVNAALRYIQSKFNITLPLLPNTTICTGVGGAGKSEVLGRIATKDQGANAWVSGPTQSQIDGIVNANKLPKAKGVAIWELVERIVGKSVANKIKTDIESASQSSNFYDKTPAMDGDSSTTLKDTVTIQKVQNPPEVIIIDEATHISNIVLQIIAKFAEQNNIQLLLLGDNAQTGLHNGIIHNIDKEHILAWRTPKLYLSLRDTNVQKYFNQQGLLQMFEPLLDSLGEVSRNIAINQIFNEFLPKFQLKYHIGTDLSGELITKTISPEVIEILKNNKDSQGKQKEVAFIGEPGVESELYKQLISAGVVLTPIMSIADIQGREYDYVISDLDWDYNIKDSEPTLARFLRNLYTVITRSKKGTILIDNHLSDKIKNKQDSLTGPSTDIRDAIEDFRNKALEDLKDIPSQQANQPGTEPKQIEEKVEVPLGEEQGPTITPEEVTEIVQKSKEEVKNFEQNQDFPIRCYSNVHIRNTSIRQDGDNEVWVGNGSNKDISIFLKNGEEAKTKEEKDRLERSLLELKCILVYGKGFYRYTDNQNPIREIFDESSFENVETYITAEDATDDNTLTGLTNLKNDERLTKGKLITIIAKLKGKDGNTYTVTLGGVAKPETWEKYADIILGSNKATDEDKEWADKLKKSIIPSYNAQLDDLISSGNDIPVDVNMSQMTELIDKDGYGNPNPELRLLDIDVDPEGNQSDRTPYDNKTKYAVRSKVYTPTNKDLTWLDKRWVGRPIMFVSSNIFLKPNDLIKIYKDQQADGINRGVRLVPLSNKGVSFRSLYKLKWRGIYHTPGSKNTLPFETLPQAIRMYISMWNFRANLQKFMDVLDEWKKGANSENRTISDDEVMDLIKLDQVEYNRVKGRKKYIDEKTYREGVSEEAKAKLKILWDFNDSLSSSVREFRLGYDDNNGLRIRALTNIASDNPFYSEKIKKLKNKTIMGVYIRPDLAQKYLDTLNALFDNVINKIVPTDRDPKVWIDKEETLKGGEEGWFKEKLRDRTSMSISGVDENGKPINSTIEFQDESTIKMIPLSMILMAKYIGIRQYDPEIFDEYYINSEDPDNPRYHIQITQDGKKVSLDYRSVADTLGLLTTDTEGNYKPGLGLKPYNEDDKTGTVDRRLDNLLSLMFHGLVETKKDNYFDNLSDLRATDADFKYGFFSDPTAIVSEGDDFRVVSTNEALFSTNLLPGMPIISFKINKDKTYKSGPTKEKSKKKTKPVVSLEPNQLQVLKQDISNVTSQLGINISKKMLNKLNTEQELINYVNSLLNPIFAQGNNQTEIETIKNRSIIYQYFTGKQAGKISSLVDHIEIVDGKITPVLINIGLPVDENWTEVWDKNEECCKILSSPDGKSYKIRFNKDTGEITSELLNKVELRGESKPETRKVEPTWENIEFTIWSYIEEYLLTINNEFAEELKALVQDEFASIPNKKQTPNSDKLLKKIVDNIITNLREEYDFDEQGYEGWNEAREKLITEILSEINLETRLREGCIK